MDRLNNKSKYWKGRRKRTLRCVARDLRNARSALWLVVCIASTATAILVSEATLSARGVRSLEGDAGATAEFETRADPASKAIERFARRGLTG